MPHLPTAPETPTNTATISSAADVPKHFQLLRLILIDSLSSGRIVELPLDGGAVLTGRNGRGKTSLLQLLLLFYGESPNRIVTTEAGREPFTGYYLPRTTSYIVFEYQRPDGQKRLVVAYANRNGERVFYRFVRHGFELGQFVTVSGEIVPTTDLVRHLKIAGYQCADQQIESLAEYRAVIQAVASGTRDRERQRLLRSLVADYAFTPGNQPLAQIEKIVSGMFRRKTNFEDLQSMVVDCVADQESSLALSGDRRKIEDWPRHYKAYRDVMALAPVMDDADTAHQQLIIAEQSLSAIHSQYLSLRDHLDTRLHDSHAEKHQQQAQADREAARYQAERAQLSQQQQNARQEADFNEKKAKELQEQHDAYARLQIEDKAALAEQEPALHSERAALQQRRTTLLGAQADISNSYAQLKQSAREDFTRLRDELQYSRQTLSAACETDLQKLEDAFNQNEQRSYAENEPARQHLQQTLEQANSELGRCQQAAQHPQADPATEQHLQEKRDQLEQAHSDKDEQKHEQEALDTGYRTALQAFDAQEKQVTEQHKTVDQASQTLQNMQRLHAPEAGTLLHFLRTEHPDWMFDVAKVIRPDIFERKDLSPGLLETQPGLYGLSLNLDKLNTHPLADQQAAQQEIEQAERRLQTLQVTLDSARKQLNKLDAARKATDKARQQQTQKSLQAQNRLTQVRREVEEAQRQVTASKRDAQARAQQALEQARQQRTQQRQALDNFDQALKTAGTQRRAAYQQQRQTRLGQREQALATLQNREQAAQQALDKHLAEYDRERDAALSAKGVDTQQLTHIDTEIKRVQDALSAIRRDAEQVSGWKHWQKHDWPNHSQLLNTAEQHRSTERSHAQALQTLAAVWTKREQALKTGLTALAKTLQTLEEQRKAVQQRVENLQSYPASDTPTYDPTWTLDTLAALANEQVNQVAGLQKTIQKHVTTLQRGFNTHAHTPPEQFLQSNHSDLPVHPGREWIALFKRWFTAAHHDYRRLLLADAKLIAASIQAFHRDMEDFHRKVQQFNRELQANLDTSMLFDSIADVHVEVISTIRELQYWPAICDMLETNRAWLEGLADDLPPTEFAQTIDRLLEHWEVKSGIRAELKHLIRLQGEVTENGNRRVFRKASDLEAVSSNGLSYLVLVIIFVAFINRIRRHAQVNIVWALDELKDLDSGNVPALLELLRRNNITLVSAFPDPDPETLALFRHRFTVEPDRRLAEIRIAEEELFTHV